MKHVRSLFLITNPRAGFMMTAISCVSVKGMFRGGGPPAKCGGYVFATNSNIKLIISGNTSKHVLTYKHRILPKKIQSKLSLRPLWRKRPALVVTTTIVKPRLNCHSNSVNKLCILISDRSRHPKATATTFGNYQLVI